MLRLIRWCRALVYLAISLTGACWLRRTRGDHLALYGYYGAADDSPIRNIGDNAILISMLEQMQSIDIPKLIFVFDKEGKYATYGEEYQIHAPGWRRLMVWLPIIARTRVFIMGGGGMLQDYTGGGGTTSFLCALNLLFRLAGRKIMWYSSGIGPLASRKARQCTGWAARAATMITVRDSRSRELLEELGVPACKVVATTDPTFGLLPPVKNTIPTKEEIIRRVGLSVLPFYRVSGIDPTGDRRIVEEYRKFIRYLANRNIQVTLVAFDNSQDRQICENILTGNHVQNVNIAGIGTSPQDMLRVYQNCDAVLAMRLHSLIFGLIAGVPTGAVIYHPKVRALVNKFQLERYACELGEMTAEHLMGILQALGEDQAAYRERMAPLVAAERELLRQNDAILRQLIGADDGDAA
ncbi:MAG: polysaccharide pyruvyl transferase family protein [Fidelibacterota bacterium]|nr:MAG: polysaccharide pyruvyl transferase family protein [Candidatus Neomarinimicrobiota bacterium]